MARQGGLWTLRQAEPVQSAHLVKKVLKHRLLNCLSASPGPQSGQQLCQRTGRIVEQHVRDALAAAGPHQGFLPALAQVLSEAVHLPLLPAGVCLQGADLRLQAACLAAQVCLQLLCSSLQADCLLDVQLPAELAQQMCQGVLHLARHAKRLPLPSWPSWAKSHLQYLGPALTRSWQMQGPPFDTSRSLHLPLFLIRVRVGRQTGCSS